MKKSVVFVFFFFTIQFVYSQNVLKGKVVDSKTGLPISAVSVYINNSTKGVSTDTNGQFVLENIYVSTFDIVASCVGYQIFSRTIIASDLAKVLEIKLIPKTEMLDAVVINAYEKDGWKKWGKTFTESILGIIDASEYCEIKNRDAIKFMYNKSKQELSAVADEPIIIVNKYLGYELRYDLINFNTNFKTKLIFYEGYPFFTNLNGSSKKINKWKDNRKNAYEGSVMHFMRALYRNKLDENNFEIRVLKRYANTEKERVKKMYADIIKLKTGNVITQNTDSANYYHNVMRQSDSLDYVHPDKIKADSIAYVVDSTTAGLDFKEHLQIKFTILKKVIVPSFYHNEKKKQFPVSIISKLSAEDIYVYSNGAYYNPSNLLTEQYWGMYEKLSTLLPLDYVEGN